MICTQTKKPVHSRQKGSLIGNQTFQQNNSGTTTTSSSSEDIDEKTKKIVDLLNQEKKSQEQEGTVQQNIDDNNDEDENDDGLQQDSSVGQVSSSSDTTDNSNEESGNAQQKIGWDIMVTKASNDQSEIFEETDGQTQQQQKNKKYSKSNIFEFYSLPEKYEYSQIDIKKYLEISQKYIDFGRFFPGQEFEREIELINISQENIIVNVALTNEFEGSYKLKKSDISTADLDEHSNKLQLLIAAQSSTCFVIQLFGQTNMSEQIMDIALVFQLEGFPIKTDNKKDVKPIIEKSRENGQQENSEQQQKSNSDQDQDQDQIKEDNIKESINNSDDDNDDNNNKNDQQEDQIHEDNDNNEEDEEDENDEERKKEIVIPVLAQLLIPQIACPKAMVYNNMKVIKLACKLANPQTEMRVVFQVQKYSSIVDIEFIDDEPNDFVSIRAKIPLVIVDYNGFLMLNVQMRPNFINIKDNSIKKVTKVLLLKLRNTSLIFSFPVVIEIC